MRGEIVRWQWRMYAGKAMHHVLPLAHGSVLALADHSQLLAIGFAVPKIFNVLLNTLFGHLALELAGRALCVDMCKLVLVDAGSCFPQEAPLAATVNRRLPFIQTSSVSQSEGNSVAIVAGACKGEYGSQTEAKKVVDPLICGCQYGMLLS